MGRGKVRVSPDKKYLEVQVGVYYEDFNTTEALRFANELIAAVGIIIDAREAPKHASS